MFQGSFPLKFKKKGKEREERGKITIQKGNKSNMMDYFPKTKRHNNLLCGKFKQQDPQGLLLE